MASQAYALITTALMLSTESSTLERYHAQGKGEKMYEDAKYCKLVILITGSNFLFAQVVASVLDTCGYLNTSSRVEEQFSPSKLI